MLEKKSNKKKELLVRDLRITILYLIFLLEYEFALRSITPKANHIDELQDVR